MKNQLDLSIIIPLYNEEENIFTLHKSVKSVMSKLKKSHEMIFVDDGSTDNSVEKLKGLQKRDKSIRIIILRKNFGQSAAISAGFSNANGNILIVMDADLQNDPGDIPKLLDKIKQGYDVASGLPYKKESVNDLELYGEMHRYIPALIAAKGFKIGEVKVEHYYRKYGKSKYGSSRLLKGFLDLLYIHFLTKYSSRPLHFFGYLGLFPIIIGVIIGFFKTVQQVAQFFSGKEVVASPLVLFSIFLIIIGVLFIIFGFLAELIIRMHYQNTKNKNYSIKEII